MLVIWLEHLHQGGKLVKAVIQGLKTIQCIAHKAQLLGQDHVTSGSYSKKPDFERIISVCFLAVLLL